MNTFTVTRQHRWSDGLKIVEISQGNINYANPDALCKKWQGECEEYIGMTNAVETAIGIAKAWQETTPDPIFIAIGFTNGMTIEFDAMPLNDETFDYLLNKAEKFDHNLPKCEHCGDLLSTETYTYDDYSFCSQNCAENHYQENVIAYSN